MTKVPPNITIGLDSYHRSIVTAPDERDPRSRWFQRDWSLQLSYHISGNSFFPALQQQLGDTSVEDQGAIDRLHTVYSLNQRFALYAFPCWFYHDNLVNTVRFSGDTSEETEFIMNQL